MTKQYGLQELHSRFQGLVQQGVLESRIIQDAGVLGLDDQAGCIKVMYTFERRRQALELLDTKEDSRPKLKLKHLTQTQTQNSNWSFCLSLTQWHWQTDSWICSWRQIV